eukprot:scaffold9.g3107.t1
MALSPIDHSRLARSAARFVTIAPGDIAGLSTEWQSEEERQTLRALVEYVASACAPPVASGVQLSAALPSSRLVPTGCPSIDLELLGEAEPGGLREGQLTEICGDSVSGKTQLCLSTAALAAGRGERVVWVDSGNAFRVERLIALLRAHWPALQVGCLHVRAAVVATRAASLESRLQGVEVHSAYDLHSLLLLLAQLQRQVDGQRTGERAPQQQGEQRQKQAQQADQRQPPSDAGVGGGDEGTGGAVVRQPQQGQPEQEPGPPPPDAQQQPQPLQPEQLPAPAPLKLLVVDSLSALAVPVLAFGASAQQQGAALLAATGAALKRLAADANAVVLVTNHLVEERRDERGEGRGGGWSGGPAARGQLAPQPRRMRPAMGQRWCSQPHARIQLASGHCTPGGAGLPDVGARTAVLTASTSSAPRLRPVRFWLTAQGLAGEPPGEPPGAAPARSSGGWRDGPAPMQQG